MNKMIEYKMKCILDQVILKLNPPPLINEPAEIEIEETIEKSRKPRWYDI